ncbi:MAG: hypothetical protein A2007_06525 [Verrucomicrobia bacterium GWC2_42_7]|nr:MAG: hypothetical protein A2007_06525 [Verrucomicrobia bacterium GWC2_42_7]
MFFLEIFLGQERDRDKKSILVLFFLKAFTFLCVVSDELPITYTGACYLILGMESCSGRSVVELKIK